MDPSRSETIKAASSLLSFLGMRFFARLGQCFRFHALAGLACALLLSLAAIRAHAGIFDWVSKPTAEDVRLAGVDRSPAKLYRPRNARDGRTRPLVILLHGYSATAERTAAYFGFADQVDKLDFLLLVPQGTKNSRGDSFWNATDFCCDNERSGVDDVGYLRALVHEIQDREKIDARRIYLVGHSNGGFLVNRLACEESGVFAAVATLAGGSFKNESDCRYPSPVAFLEIHGIDDPTIHFDDQPNYAGGSETLHRRIKVNACVGDGERKKPLDLVAPIPGEETSVTTWQSCARGMDVALWLIPPYQGHPGSAHKPAFTNGAGASILTWLFDHRLSPGDAPVRP